MAEIIELLSSGSDEDVNRNIYNSSRKPIKRKLSSSSDDDFDEKKSKIIDNKKRVCLQSSPLVKRKDDPESPKPSTSGIVMPKLVIKQKETIVNLQCNVYLQFLNTCLKVDDSEFMKKHVQKFKEKYMDVDPIYLQSEEFKTFLIAKTNAISSKKMAYSVLKDVFCELKSKRIRKSVKGSDSDGSYLGNNESDRTLSKNDLKKIRLLEDKMEKCKIRIAELEEKEVDWDDDDNSDYIKEDRYKKKYMELYNCWCDIIGDKFVSVKYIKLKDLQGKDSKGMTGIEELDTELVTYVNKNIRRFNIKRKKKPDNIPDHNYVPDYVEILQQVKKLNEEKKLQLADRKIDEYAQKSFKTIGQYLKKTRMAEYLETYSHFFENVSEEDPALTNQELKKSLLESQKEGEKNMNQIFDTFARKQDERRGEKDSDDSKTDEEGSNSDDSESESNETKKSDVDEEVKTEASPKKIFKNDEIPQDEVNPQKVLPKLDETAVKKMMQSPKMAKLIQQSVKSSLYVKNPMCTNKSNVSDKLSANDKSKEVIKNNFNIKESNFGSCADSQVLTPVKIVKMHLNPVQLVKSRPSLDPNKSKPEPVLAKIVPLDKSLIEKEVRPSPVPAKVSDNSLSSSKLGCIKVRDFAAQPKNWYTPEISSAPKIVPKKVIVQKPIKKVLGPAVVDLTEEEDPIREKPIKKMSVISPISKQKIRIIPPEKTVIVRKVVNNYHINLPKIVASTSDLGSDDNNK